MAPVGSGGTPLSVVGAGQREGVDGAVGVVAADGADQGPHGGTGGKDIIDEEEGGIGVEGGGIGGSG